MKHIVRNPDGSHEGVESFVFGRYRKLPVVIDAVRLHEPVAIDTLEGTMIGNAGDWLICGVNGEYYPCKNDVFQKTYKTDCSVGDIDDEDPRFDIRSM